MYPAKVKIESMEEYYEAKTYKGKSELRNSKILTISFIRAEIKIIAS